MTRIRVASACAAAALSATSTASAQPTPISPGYWESQESYSILLSVANKEKKCLTRPQIAKFIESPSLKRYGCTYEKRRLENGQAKFEGGSCFSKSGRKVLSDVTVGGTFEPEHFHLDARFKLMVSAGGGIGLPGSAEIDAHRISADCPAEAAASK